MLVSQSSLQWGPLYPYVWIVVYLSGMNSPEPVLPVRQHNFKYRQRIATSPETVTPGQYWLWLMIRFISSIIHERLWFDIPSWVRGEFLVDKIICRLLYLFCEPSDIHVLLFLASSPLYLISPKFISPLIKEDLSLLHHLPFGIVPRILKLSLTILLICFTFSRRHPRYSSEFPDQIWELSSLRFYL